MNRFGRATPVTLVTDGPTFHNDDGTELKDRLRTKNVFWETLPAYSTSVLQPLDLKFFKVLKQKFDDAECSQLPALEVMKLIPKLFAEAVEVPL